MQKLVEVSNFDLNFPGHSARKHKIYILASMGRKYTFHNNDSLYFVSFAVVRWLDVFTRRLYFDIVVDSLRYCIDHKGLNLYAWCIMSNHVHLIINSDTAKLSDIMRDLKRHTAKALLKAIEENPQESRKELLLYLFERSGTYVSSNEKYQFWQHNNHPIELSTNERLWQRLNYLHNNPVVSGAVDYPPHYLYSSARDYYTNEPGLLPIILVQP